MYSILRFVGTIGFYCHQDYNEYCLWHCINDLTVNQSDGLWKKPYVSLVVLVYMQCSEASTRGKGLEQVVSPYEVWPVSPLLLQLSCLILPVWDIFLGARGVIGLQWCCLPVSRLWICRSAERRARGHRYSFFLHFWDKRFSYDNAKKS